MNTLATSIVFLGAAVSAGSALAASPQVYGTVVSSTPVVSQVTVPRQQCVDVPGTVRAQPSGLGALVGGALGGLAGNQIGAGAGRAVATGVGAIAGIVAGANIEAAAAPSVPVTTTQCNYAQTTESRIVGYDVVYELNGQRYTARLPQDPGPRIALAVQPTANSGAAPSGASPYGASPYDAPPPDGSAQYAAPAPVPGYAPYPPPYAYPAPYPAYAPYPGYVYPEIVIGGRFGYRHWR
jgi:uncharacterized protein YcfJ